MDVSEKRVRDQEVANQKRLVELSHQIRDAEVESSQKLDDIKDVYERREVDLINQREESLQRQQVEGYARLMELKRQQNADLSKSRQIGEKTQFEVQSFYDGEVNRATRDGEVKLRNVQIDSALTTETIRREGDNHAKLELLQQQGEKQNRETVHRASMQLQEKEHREEATKATQFFDEAAQRTVVQGRERHGKIVSQSESELLSLFRNSKQQLDAIRSDSSRKLAAYSSRQSDPFYQPVILGADMAEGENEYVITAKIPQHEQQFLSVSVKGGNELVVSGQRRAKEVINKPDGGNQTTANFQSYSETFKLPIPVQREAIDKEFRGEQLTIRIPKVGLELRPGDRKKMEAKAPRLEKPRFPDNIPVDKFQAGDPGQIGKKDDSPA